MAVRRARREETLSRAPTGIYNVGANDVISVSTLARRVASYVEPVPIVAHGQGRSAVARGQRLNTAKLRALGWKPTHTLDEAIRELLAEAP